MKIIRVITQLITDHKIAKLANVVRTECGLAAASTCSTETANHIATATEAIAKLATYIEGDRIRTRPSQRREVKELSALVRSWS